MKRIAFREIEAVNVSKLELCYIVDRYGCLALADLFPGYEDFARDTIRRVWGNVNDMDPEELFQDLRARVATAAAETEFWDYVERVAHSGA
jgi:hypothetical protein